MEKNSAVVTILSRDGYNAPVGNRHRFFTRGYKINFWRMRISRNFTLQELTKSQTAERLGLDNTPSEDIIKKLKEVTINVLQKVRDNFGTTVVSSGYRSLEVNRAIGSKDTSQHTKGEAVDFEVPGLDNYDLANWIKNNLEFDQLILEFYEKSKGSNSGWVHVSYKSEGNRNEVLTINSKGVHLGLVK